MSDVHNDPPGDDLFDEVGYRKPPKAHRFKNGRSGNPRGRPKGAKSGKPVLSEESVRDIVLEEGYRMATGLDGGQPVTLPMVRVIVRSVFVQAAKGKGTAQQLSIKMLSTAEQEKRREMEAIASKSTQEPFKIIIVDPVKDWNDTTRPEPDDDSVVGAGTITKIPDKS